MRLLRPLLLTLALLPAGTAAWAQVDELATPRLLVKPLESQPIGARIDIATTLVGIEDRPLGNNVLELYLDGEYQRRIRTDEVGTATIRISRTLQLGDYLATVRFIGTKDYAAVEVQVPFTVRPARLTVETVPPLAGVPFAIAGQTVESDALGQVVAELPAPGRYDLEILLDPGTLLRPDTMVSFSRWNDAVFTPAREVEYTNRDLTLQVGLELYHPVTTRFTDLLGDPIDWSRVTSLTLKSSSAAYRTITEEQQPYWLQANRVMRQRSGLFPTPLLWSVESVILDGSNVVNRYQQRFYVEANDVWDIGLLLYQAHIRSRDALFGFPVGTGVSMTYPDGTQQDLRFDTNNDLIMTNLARGLYKLQVQGVQGVAPVTPVAMTRDQEVELKVFSGVDIGAVILLGLLLALGLLFYGRPHLIGLGRRKKARSKRTEAKQTPALPACSDSERMDLPMPPLRVEAVPVEPGTPPRSAAQERAARHARGCLPEAPRGDLLEAAPQHWRRADPPDSVKTMMVLLYLHGEASITELAGWYWVAPSRIHRWVADYLEEGSARRRQEGGAGQGGWEPDR